MELSHIIIDARVETDWFEKAKQALENNQPMRLIGNEEQIRTLLKHARSIDECRLIQETASLKLLADLTLSIDL